MLAGGWRIANDACGALRREGFRGQLWTPTALELGTWELPELGDGASAPLMDLWEGPRFQNPLKV